MRFDLRNATADHYAAALDMGVWAEAHGALSVAICEHHASSDGYLPAPLLLASALAARTSTLNIQIAALIVPLHDPVELAEQMAVLDLLSRGRVGYICAIGYRAEEYDMAGRSMRDRGRRLEEAVHVFRQAWTGEPFEHRGRQCLVRPTPMTPNGPFICLGGASEAAAKRAARLGLGFLGERDSGLREVYEKACAEGGTTPQLFFEAPADAITAAFVHQDPDRFWDDLGPHVLHDQAMYHEWNVAAGKPLPASVTDAASVEAIRAAGTPYRVFAPGEAAEELAAGRILNLHPLVGGLAPELAWESLRALEPVLSAASRQ